MNNMSVISIIIWLVQTFLLTKNASKHFWLVVWLVVTTFFKQKKETSKHHCQLPIGLHQFHARKRLEPRRDLGAAGLLIAPGRGARSATHQAANGVAFGGPNMSWTSKKSSKSGWHLLINILQLIIFGWVGYSMVHVVFRTHLLPQAVPLHGAPTSPWHRSPPPLAPRWRRPTEWRGTIQLPWQLKWEG